MSQGSAPRQGDLFRDTTAFCRAAGPAGLDPCPARTGSATRCSPTSCSATCSRDVGRRSVPPLVVAVVMVLQRLEGLSDREAVERFTFDARWKYAAGGLPFDYPGFAHTVLVDMRARLARSERPEPDLRAHARGRAGRRGSSGVRRVLDSTPLYDAVATMDTVTLVRSRDPGRARGVGRAGARRCGRSCAATTTTARGGKPACRLGGRRTPARPSSTRSPATARRVLAALEGEPLSPAARRGRHPARDRPRPGPRGGPRRPDPDRPAGRPRPGHQHGRSRRPPRPQDRGPRLRRVQGPRRARPRRRARHRDRRHAGQRRRRLGRARRCSPTSSRAAAEPTASAARRVRRRGVRDGPAARDARGRRCRQPRQGPAAERRAGGRFTKDDFAIDLAAGTVTCPAGPDRAAHAPRAPGSQARFRLGLRRLPARRAGAPTSAGRAQRSRSAPTRRCSRAGRAASRDPAWRADYRATRPKVERKLAHLMRRRHGGRRARVRGRLKVGADFALLAAAVNLARLAVLGVTGSGGTWAVRPA